MCKGEPISCGEFGFVYHGIDSRTGEEIILKLCPPLALQKGPGPAHAHKHVYNPALLAFSGLDAMLHCGTDILLSAAVIRDPWGQLEVRPLVVLRASGHLHLKY